MNLEDITLGEISQSQKDIHYIDSFYIWYPEQSDSEPEGMVVARAVGERGGSYYPMGTGFEF